MEKLKRKALPETLEAALCEVHDAVGVRVICSFADDVFRVEKWLKSQENYELVKEKDYISYPRPNGYRGIHLILRGMKNGGNLCGNPASHDRHGFLGEPGAPAEI